MAQQIRPVEFMEPGGHLLSMTAELALKAFLLEVGMTDRELGSRKIGHDLGAILREAVERGLRLYEEDVVHILVMRTAHLEHFHRYGPQTLTGGAYTSSLLKDEEVVLKSLARILDLIGRDPKGLRHLHQRPIDLDWPQTAEPSNPVTPARLADLAASIEAHAKKVEGFGVPHVRT